MADSQQRASTRYFPSMLTLVFGIVTLLILVFAVAVLFYIRLGGFESESAQRYITSCAQLIYVGTATGGAGLLCWLYAVVKHHRPSWVALGLNLSIFAVWFLQAVTK